MHALKLCLWIHVVTQPNVAVFSLMSSTADPSPIIEATLHIYTKTRHLNQAQPVNSNGNAI